MKFLSNKKSLKFSAYLFSSLLLGASFTSCEGIYDYEGDCDVTYNIKFNYDKNLKWANAFPAEVNSVRLYAFDERGALAGEFSAKGSELADENYSMRVDLQPGKYHFVAWCGLDNDTNEESFSVTSLSHGTSEASDLKCKLNRKSNDVYAAYSEKRLHGLYHGSMVETLPDSQDGADYTYTMHLTKNTNHVRIILQQLSGEDVEASDFTFKLEDKNGHMAHDNSLLDDDLITYLPWNQTTGVAGVGKSDTRDIVYVNGAIADITTPRMMAAHKDDMMLTISNNDGETVAQIPFIHYALLAKDYYEDAYGHKMDDQEFLDREDEYTMTFFLDERNKWVSSSILIHSWRIVLNNVDL